MNKQLFARVFLLSVLVQLSVAATAQPQPVINDSIQSTILKESRELRVILPQTYKAESKEKFEVVYICDGEWYQELVPDTYNFAESAGFIPKAIFVLMRNRYIDGRNMRDRDFSPVSVGDPITGGADRFYDFVTKEVVPYIEGKYPSNGQRTLVGSSFSGLFSVFAFLKDPSFFHSFVASDPNISFGNDYVTTLAAKTLPQLKANPGSLFFAGLTSTYRGMGIFGLDSVLKANAPQHLKWKCITYENETHYSVQLKAFYDGFRFSHFGYDKNSPEYHPAKGMVLSGKTFLVYSLNNNPSAKITIDGSEPVVSSPYMKRDTSIQITVPAKVRIKTFGNRSAYNNEWEGNFTTGSIRPSADRKKNKKAGLTYAFYKGKWDHLTAQDSLPAQTSGRIDSTFSLANILKNDSGYISVKGDLEIEQDGEYIFYTNGFDEVQLNVADKILFNEKNSGTNPNASFVVSLARGRYPLEMKILRNNNSLEPHFVLFRSNGNKDKWWESVVMKF